MMRSICIMRRCPEFDYLTQNDMNGVSSKDNLDTNNGNILPTLMTNSYDLRLLNYDLGDR